jgi:hypothetical protein
MSAKAAQKNNMQLKTLTYTSLARFDLTDRELDDIHLAARHLNAIDGVTGILMFDGIRFLQIIEGADQAVDDLIERLRRDPRHSAVEVRDERFVGARSFPDWSMELVRVSAGFKEARKELASLLPESATPGVRDLVLKMTEELSSRV